MRYKNFASSLLIAASVSSFACSSGSAGNNRADSNINTNVSANPPASETKVAVPTPETPTQNPDFKIEMSSAPQGAETEMTFIIKDKNGSPVKNFKTVHEKKMHLIVVSEDLAEFEHLHPALQADGSFKVRHAFRHGGKFLLYPDVTPENGTQVVQRMEMNVSGEPKTSEKLVADLNLRKTVEGITVTMKPEKEPQALTEMTINFIVTDEATGKPVTDLQNFLGELAHVVVISEDTRDFLHVHPMSSKKPGETSVMAHTTFPRAGIYKVWAQFQRNNRVITVPYVVNVAEGAPKTVSAARPENGAIRINVDSKGFSPAAVELKKGEAVKLLFNRADEKNCANEVVFAALNIKKELPAGQETAVEITPNESGEITFACGMNMYKGKIVVQ